MKESKIIKGMIIRGIEMEEDASSQINVDRDYLEFWSPEKYREDLTEDEYFMLAIEYIEGNFDDVVCTDYAKIDYVF